MKTRARAWGSGLALRIPMSLATKARLREGSPVRLSLADGAILVQPMPDTDMTLKGLLSGVTKENCHDEIEWGRRVGREAW